MNKQDKAKTKQSFKTVVSNNWFMMKLMLKAAPSYLIFYGLDAMRNQVSIFFEHTVLIGYVLEAAEFHYPFKRVAFVVLMMAGLISLGMVFTVIASDFVGETRRPVVRERVRMLLYEKVKDIDLECYDDPEFYNNQVLALSEIDKQIERMVSFVQNTVSGITVFVSTGIYFLMKDKFSIIFAVVSFVLAFVFNQIFNKLSYLLRIERNPDERKRSYVNRVFYLNDYAKEIRLNPGVSDILMDRFKQANDNVYKTEKKYAKKRFFARFMAQHVSNNLFSDVFYIGYLVIKAAAFNALSLSSDAILYNSFGRLKRGLRIFTDIYPFASETSLYVQKIRDFIDYEPKIKAGIGKEPKEGPKEIEVINAGFKYPTSDDLLLKDINLKIRPGEKIALVGYNGAGKTTLVKLLMRLYDLSEGSILMDGTDIKEYELTKYRKTIGTVFQDFQIFAGTVRDNVVMDDKEVDDENVINALSESGLKKRLDSFEKGLDTNLTTEFEKDGVNLSGGESQKLACARVFYGQADLMILDEPSSALDPIAEYQLNHAMLTATKNKTVIFISHRLSTTRLADRIVMLENGRVVEEGTHRELLERDGKYAGMWRVQAGAYINV